MLNVVANGTVFTLQFISNYNSVTHSFLPFPLCWSLSSSSCGRSHSYHILYPTCSRPKYKQTRHTLLWRTLTDRKRIPGILYVLWLHYVTIH